MFYCSKWQKDKTQVKQRRQSSPITYITKYTIEHYNIELHEFIVNIYSKWRHEEINIYKKQLKTSWSLIDCMIKI